MSGKFDAGGAGAGGAGGAEGIRDRARDAAEEVRSRAEGLGDQVQDQASRIADRAERAMDESGARNTLDRYPLAAFGLAFGLGYVLAGSSDSGGALGKMKHQLRGAIMGGISAAIAQQAQTMLGMQSGAGGES